jgi:hypothetical protein
MPTQSACVSCAFWALGCTGKALDTTKRKIPLKTDKKANETVFARYAQKTGKLIWHLFTNKGDG